MFILVIICSPLLINDLITIDYNFFHIIFRDNKITEKCSNLELHALARKTYSFNINYNNDIKYIYQCIVYIRGFYERQVYRLLPTIKASVAIFSVIHNTAKNTFSCVMSRYQANNQRIITLCYNL